MKIGVLLFAGLLVVTGASVRHVAQDIDDKAHQDWLEARYKEATSIQPGMTRADLMKLFDQEGGLQGDGLQAPARYVLKNCFLIHIDVTFDRPTREASRNVPDEQLKIVEVSKPYLARLVID